MDPKDNADVVLVRAISVTHVGFFFFFCLLLLGIGPEIELKASDRERERLIQREVDRTKAREF